MTAMARTDSTAPMAPTAMPAFAPVDSDGDGSAPPSPLPLAACVSVAAVAAADVVVVVAEAELPVAAEPAVAAEEEEEGDDDDVVSAAAVTAYPSSHEIVPPTEDGRLACRSSACSPTKSVALLVQSQVPMRLREVYASDGTEHPAHAHSLAVLLTASHRTSPTHSCSSKSSDFHGQEPSVYWASVQPAR